MIGLLGKKIGMTQFFSQDGKVIPVIVIEGGPCLVIQVKNRERDGYIAVQMGYHKGKRNLNRPMRGHFKKTNSEPTRYLREFRVADTAGIETGQQLTVEQFKIGDFVDVSGKTKGKGFQGGVKRWGWRGGGGAHGSMQHRKPGSIGSNTTPGRVFRGHHLPGHTGDVRRTIQNLRVLQINSAENLLVVHGSVPGAMNGLLEIHPAVKRKAISKVKESQMAKETVKKAKKELGSKESKKETKK